MNDFVSVLIPVHNAAPYLSECLSSALRQTHSNLEILCYDDGSQDASGSILSEFAQSDGRLRVYSAPVNRGVVHARNQLLEECRGDYIAWLDADDFIAQEKIATQLAFLQAHPNCGAVGTGVAFVDLQGNLVRTEKYPDDPDRQSIDPYLCCASVLVRRESALCAGRFRSLFLRGGEDGDWLLRIADRWELRNIPDPLYSYRINPKSISTSHTAVIRRVGVIARMAARERRRTGVCPIDSGEYATASPEEVLASKQFTPAETVLALSLWDPATTPLLAVAIPYYEAYDFLPECLKSLEAQSFQNFEVIIFDDGSSEPLELQDLHSWAPTLEGRIHLFRDSHNRGPAHARNRILQSTHAPFIIFQDADDTSEPARLWKLLEAMVANPDHVAIGSGVAFTDVRGQLLRSEVFPAQPIIPGGFNGCCGSFIYDRRRAPELRFDESLKGSSEDVDFLIRLESYGRLRNLPDLLYRYRIRPRSLTSHPEWLRNHLNFMWRLFAKRMGVSENAPDYSARLIDFVLAADGTQSGELFLTKAYRDWRGHTISTRRFVALMRIFPRSALHILHQHFLLAVESQTDRLRAACPNLLRTLLRGFVTLAAKAVHAVKHIPRPAFHRSRPHSRPIHVQILDNWGDADEALAFLLPGRKGTWDRVHFHTETTAFRKPDYILILNQPSKPLDLQFSPNRIWFAIGEPPTACHEPFHIAQGTGTVVFTPAQYPSLQQNGTGDRSYRFAHAMTRTWWVKRTFEELNRIDRLEKTELLSWLTSDISMLRGHRERLAFLNRARNHLNFDLYGRGFQPLEDKWSGLAPYHFSIAYENTRANGYFTEKLMDCFVSLTVPFYVGAPDIYNYFPSDSLILIDPNDPDVFKQMQEHLTVTNYERRLIALQEAKRLVLTRYNLFIYLADAIMNNHEPPASPCHISITPKTLDWSLDQ